MIPVFSLAFPSDRLFARALRILDDAGARYGRAFDWTFGCGTVLALRHAHRVSRDIDVFVPDPQYLGYLTPRLSDVAAEGDPDYEEGAEFLKLRYPEGEVDFVVAGVLTHPGTECARVNGRQVNLETDVEIVAKKLFFRGNRFKARDLFDLAMVLEKDELAAAALIPWADRHRSSLISLLRERPQTLRTIFEGIAAATFRPDFDAAAARALIFLQANR